MLQENNLISTLEQSLRQFKSAQSRLEERLQQVEIHIKKYEDEAADLREEIAALEQSGVRTDEALKSLRATLSEK